MLIPLFFQLKMTDFDGQKVKLDIGRAKMAWYSSPNFDKRMPGALVDTIVIHHTSGSSLDGVCLWFASKESQVSAHYTIGKDGTIVQHVSGFMRAWHAGVSKDVRGKAGVNHFSIGIELDNLGDGKDLYPDVQVESLKKLIGSLVTYRFKNIWQITSHEYVAEPFGRKNDPLGFPWEKLEPLAKEHHLRIIRDLKLDPKSS